MDHIKRTKRNEGLKLLNVIRVFSNNFKQVQTPVLKQKCPKNFFKSILQFFFFKKKKVNKQSKLKKNEFLTSKRKRLIQPTKGHETISYSSRRVKKVLIRLTQGLTEAGVGRRFCY